MGEFIRNHKTGEEIKVATMNQCFFSRAEIQTYADDPDWGGWYACKHEEGTLEHLLGDPSTLFALPMPFKRNPDEYPPRRVHLRAPLELAKEIEHKEHVINGGYAERRNFLVPCAYTPEGMALNRGQNKAVRFRLVAIGERFDEEGQCRTIFACASCGVLFSMGDEELELVDQSPCFKQGDERWLELHPRSS